MIVLAAACSSTPKSASTAPTATASSAPAATALTAPEPGERHLRNIRQLTIAPLLAEAMKRISEESSVSSLFN